jgi:hypothetical protein
MCADDPQRGRRGRTRSFGDKSPNYSPSASYNYGQKSGNFSPSQQPQHSTQRKRPDRFKPRSGPATGNGAGFNSVDKLVKQNDIIIRLLNEIRDRLPEGDQTASRGSRNEQFNRGQRRGKREVTENPGNEAREEDGGEEEE